MTNEEMVSKVVFLSNFLQENNITQNSGSQVENIFKQGEI